LKPTLTAIESSSLPLAVIGIGAVLAGIGFALSYMRRRTK
jgi:LPXTG-motif cell wall-anchored protein